MVILGKVVIQDVLQALGGNLRAGPLLFLLLVLLVTQESKNQGEKSEMALDTLMGVEKIGGFNVVVMDELREKYPEKFNESGSMNYHWFESEIRPTNFIYVRHDKNSLSFTLQDGPIKERGVNGCQVDTVIEAARVILEGLNRQFPCRENSLAITKLEEALHWLEHRRVNREARGVEGTSQA